jgi:pyrroloquinoline-quinone synthase
MGNPYFSNLHNGTFEKDDFIETQIQFYFAVVFFNRPMCALAAKIPEPHLRLSLLDNIWEEYGEGDLRKAHSSTFVEFLDRIGNISLQTIEKRELWPEIRIFNTCLIGACVLDDYKVSVAVMGMIERMFCEISSIIANAVVKRDWLMRENLVHYNHHSDIDMQHAADFFNIVADDYQKNQENRYSIDQGIYLGATLFYNLYKELYEKRDRRLNANCLESYQSADIS